ncbi:MAG: efflux RND transporter periplasmic adaptor subunit [Eubacterium sp.]|nr:efflux RND transporter periplasmic adaptor subunit [Eubacterium sp.]
MENNIQETTNQTSEETPKKVNWNEKYGKKNGKKKGKKGLIIGLAIAAVVVGVIVYGFIKVKSAVQTAQDTLLGDGTLVEAYGEKDMSTYIDVIGSVESQNVENVYTSLTYPVKEVKVKVGDHVKKGDVVCVIDETEIDTKIADLEAQASDADRLAAKQIETANHTVSTASATQSRSLESANKSISEAKKAFEDADTDYNEKLADYNEALYKAAQTATSTDAIENNAAVKSTKAALDTASTTWYAKQYAYDQATSAYSDTAETAAEAYTSAKDSADATIISNTSSYSATASQLASYYDMKGKTIIISPIDGVVTSVSAVEGVPCNGAVMTIQDDKNLQLSADIKEKDYFNVKEGMEVEFTNSTLTNVTGTGKVSNLNNFATANVSAAGAASGAAAAAGAAVDNTFTATLTITDYTDMLIGMKVKARISTGEEMKTNAVPYTAISTNAEGDYVYVAEEAGSGMYTVVKKTITKGMSGDYYVQVTGGELEPGDKVIVYPSTVTEGGIVSIKEKDADSKDGSVVEDKDTDTEEETTEDK